MIYAGMFLVLLSGALLMTAIIDVIDGKRGWIMGGVMALSNLTLGATLIARLAQP